MITTGDVGNILYRDFQKFGLPVYKKGNIPSGEVKSERITLHLKTSSTDKIWKSVFVEANICVPDQSGTANLSRLNELERMVSPLESCGQYDGTPYEYSSEISQQEDAPLKCHFVNCRILFKILNVK